MPASRTEHIILISPLTYKEVTFGLLSLGFMHKRTASSHEQWIGYRDGRKFLVTADKPQSPYSIKLIESMAKQSGVSKKNFFLLCKGLLEIDKYQDLLVVSDPSNQ